MPWLSCFGNHDGLVLGTAIPTAGYEEVLSGTRKPVDWPEKVDPLSYEAEFTSAPELLLAGPALEVCSDPGRRSVGRRDFVAAHLQAAGNPTGHGFQPWNVRPKPLMASMTWTARYLSASSCSTPPTWTVIIKAASESAEFRWLEERLIEAHAQYFDNEGSVVRTITPTGWWCWRLIMASTQWSTNARARPAPSRTTRG